MKKPLKDSESADETIKNHGEMGESFGVQTDKEAWYGQEMSTKSAPLIDPGVGPQFVIRRFSFSPNPEFKGKLTRQELFNLHAKQVRTILWGDGLVPKEDVNPRLEFDRQGNYHIMITCQPRMRTVITDKPMNLRDILKR